MTDRLYFADSYLTEFEAAVITVVPRDDQFAVALDRTAFYPTSGGQPHDSGTLNGIPVTDVLDEQDRILHVVSVPVSGHVMGRIDWDRRFDHMQQHSGQHILSQAFLQVANAQTQSVHFGIEAATVDLDVSELSADTIERVEELANTVVFEDRPVQVREVDEGALKELELRRPPKQSGRFRIVEIEKFDRSACGGTHVRRTGEVGPIKIHRWERARGGARAGFLCGKRALRDYRWKNALVGELAGQFSVGQGEVREAVRRLMEQLSESRRTLEVYRDEALSAAALARVREVGPDRVVADVLPAQSAADITDLAGRIVESGAPVVLLGTQDGKVVFARAKHITLDMRTLLQQTTAVLGGRGGGRPEFAQGAVPSARVAEALKRAASDAQHAIDSRGS
jgi:alanyl-tRNA synthetase